jgi:hypothetical protein
VAILAAIVWNIPMAFAVDMVIQRSRAKLPSIARRHDFNMQQAVHPARRAVLYSIAALEQRLLEIKAHV